MTRAPLIHVGYHKTASSLLQSGFYSASAGSFMLPETPRHWLLEEFVVPPPYAFDPARAARAYRPFLEAAAAAGKVPVFSHERFSGYPPTGGFDAPIIARRLKQVLPEARVLIVIREQLSHIFSMYSQYVTDGGDLALGEYLSRPEPHLRRVPGFSPDFNCYDALIRDYQNLFGAQNVLVLPFELLRQDKREFAARICALVDVPEQPIQDRAVNPRRPALMQLAQRRVNALFSDNQLSRRPLIRVARASKGFNRLRPFFERLSPGALDARMVERQRRVIADTLGGHYGPSNAETMRLTGLDLAAFGYDVDADGRVDAGDGPRNHRNGV